MHRKRKTSRTGSTIKQPSVGSSGDADSGATILREDSYWETFLDDPEKLALIPPVSWFKHAPYADIWEEVLSSSIGAMTELQNPYVKVPNGYPIMWVGTITKFAGYSACVKFERFGLQPDQYLWVNFCSCLAYPVGFSIANNFRLHPQLDVAKRFPRFLKKLLTEVTPMYQTLSYDLVFELHTKMKNIQQRFPLGTKVEVLDSTFISRMRVATVTGLIGNLVHVTYETKPTSNHKGFVFHVNSEHIHPLGWANTVGVDILDPVEPQTTIPKTLLPAYPSTVRVEVGQILEARHPMDPFAICEAEVEAVFQHGYFQVAFRVTANELRTPVRYNYHIMSPYILPAGFAKKNDITLWKSKKQYSTVVPAPLHLLPPQPEHNFKIGHTFEVLDINDPGFLAPVTVEDMVEHLLLLRYDGWPTKDPASQIWMAADDPNMAPVGYSDMIGYKLQNPFF